MMTKTLLAATALMAATAAHAGDMKTAEAVTPNPQAGAQLAAVETRTVVDQGARLTFVPNTPYEVLGVVERDGDTLYAVPAQGAVFLNHIPERLFEVSTEQAVVDEYTYEYRGMTFTNHVIRDFETLTADELEGTTDTAVAPNIG